MRAGFATLLFLAVLLTVEECRGIEDYIMKEQDIRRQILSNYDRTTLPARRTTVRLRRVTIKHFNIDPASHTLAIDAWLIYEWIDPRLLFTPVDNIQKLSMSPKDIWMPDISLYNEAKVGNVNPFDDTLTLVYPNGRVLHAPPAKLHTSCVADLTYWPHDTHNCSVVLGSWVHHGYTIDFRLLEKEPKVDISQRLTADGRNITRGEWDLVSASLTRKENNYECCPEPYVSIWLTLTLQHYAPAFFWTVKLPAVGLSLLALVLFLLPPAAGEKVTLGGFCLVLDLIFIAYTSNTVAHSPSHTPLIVEMVSQQLILVIVSVVTSVLVLRMAHDPHSAGVPLVMRRPLAKLAPLLCLSNYNNLVSGFRRTLPHSLKSEEVELGAGGVGGMGGVNMGSVSVGGSSTALYPHETSIRNEWVFLAAVLDRLCFILFAFISLVSFIRFHAVL